jgi:flagellar operon protein
VSDPRINPALVPPGGLTGTPPAARTGAIQGQPTTGPAFADVLAREATRTQPLQFSGHAIQRVEKRGIDLSDGTLQRLGSGVDRAAAKGARESVVLVDGTAFVVSVPNRTVITAVGPEHMREHVFTNIDSAVIA